MPSCDKDSAAGGKSKKQRLSHRAVHVTMRLESRTSWPGSPAAVDLKCLEHTMRSVENDLWQVGGHLAINIYLILLQCLPSSIPNCLCLYIYIREDLCPSRSLQAWRAGTRDRSPSWQAWHQLRGNVTTGMRRTTMKRKARYISFACGPHSLSVWDARLGSLRASEI